MRYEMVLLALLLGAGCDRMACVRHSDCPTHLICGDEGRCVAPPDLSGPRDDGGDGDDGGVEVDLRAGLDLTTEVSPDAATTDL